MKSKSSFLVALLLALLLTIVIPNSSLSEASPQFPEDMVSYWRLDEGSGIITSDSVNDNDGIIYGATWITGQVGSALSFDGIYDYVDCGAGADLDITDAITVEAWVRLSADSIGQEIIIDKGSNEVYQMDIINSQFGFGIRNSSGTFKRNRAEAIAVSGRWYHVVGTYSSSISENNLKLYIDGQLEKETSHTGTIGSSGNLQFGRWPSGGYNFHGLIDEVGIYARVLTAGEIQQHYNNGLEGKGYCYIAPEDAIENLIEDIGEMDLTQGVENSLVSKLENALKSLEKENNGAAVNQLDAFINAVEAQSSKHIKFEGAEALVEQASDIIDIITDEEPPPPPPPGPPPPPPV